MIESLYDPLVVCFKVVVAGDHYRWRIRVLGKLLLDKEAVAGEVDCLLNDLLLFDMALGFILFVLEVGALRLTKSSLQYDPLLGLYLLIEFFGMVLDCLNLGLIDSRSFLDHLLTVFFNNILC